MARNENDNATNVCGLCFGSGLVLRYSGQPSLRGRASLGPATKRARLTPSAITKILRDAAVREANLFLEL